MVHGNPRMNNPLRLAAGLAFVIGLALSQPLMAASAVKKAGKSPHVAVKVAEKKADTKVRQKVVAEAKVKAKNGKVDAKASKLAKSGQASKRTQVALKSAGKSVKLAKGKVRSVNLARANTNDKPIRLAGKGQLERKVVVAESVVRIPQEPRLSTGERLGLRASHDPLELSSSVALVVDQETSEVLFSKNDTAVLPIASLTKLMTGLVIADANLPMDELITISEDDAAVYRNSRLAVGTTLTRGELMHLALMSSENRAANALGRTFPGGPEQFVRRMNAKAREIGMRDTRYVEPTGLSSDNQSSARDLATLVSVAYERPILRSLSTSPSHELDLGRRTLHYNNSNRLIRNPEWDIGLQKTGYISEAGRCLVMQAKVAGRKLIMVFLDSAGKLSRAQDAERVRRWVEAQTIQQQFVRPQG